MENEAANKRRRGELEPQATPACLDLINNLPNDMLRVIISLLSIKYGARTTLLSWRWRPCGTPALSTSSTPTSSAMAIAKAWMHSPRSLAVTLAQPKALEWASSVPTARTEPSLTTGSDPPFYTSSRSSLFMMGIYAHCQRPHSVSRPRCTSPSSGTTIPP